VYTFDRIPASIIERDLANGMILLLPRANNMPNVIRTTSRVSLRVSLGSRKLQQDPREISRVFAACSDRSSGRIQ